MAFLVDFLPIIIFFVAFKFGSIYIATGAAIITSLAQLIYMRLMKKKIEKMQIITFVSIIILGGATLILRNEEFIKWKPSVVYWAFSIAYLYTHFFSQKTLLEHLFGKNQADNLSHVTPATWKGLSFFSLIFFAVAGVLNIWIAHNYPTEIWVNFKLFGGLGLGVVYAIIIGICLSINNKEKVMNSKTDEQ